MTSSWKYRFLSSSWQLLFSSALLQPQLLLSCFEADISVPQQGYFESLSDSHGLRKGDLQKVCVLFWGWMNSYNLKRVASVLGKRNTTQQNLDFYKGYVNKSHPKAKDSNQIKRVSRSLWTICLCLWKAAKEDKAKKRNFFSFDMLWQWEVAATCIQKSIMTFLGCRRK